jgi:hypothetical protein
VVPDRRLFGLMFTNLSLTSSVYQTLGFGILEFFSISASVVESDIVLKRVLIALGFFVAKLPKLNDHLPSQSAGFCLRICQY